MRVQAKKGFTWLGVILVCACASNVVVDYDKQADFASYRTYGWGKGTPAKNPNLDRQIVKVIDEHMARKGYTKTEADPDLLVTYHAAAHEEIDYSEASFGQGYHSSISPSAGEVPMRVNVGEIVVDMYDTKQQRNVWHGVGTDLVRDDPSKTALEIQNGAAKMFEKFPPQ